MTTERSTEKSKIILVSSDDTEACLTHMDFANILYTCNTTCEFIPDIDSLYSNLCVPKNNVNLIGISLPGLYSYHNEDPWQVIHTIEVILKATSSEASIIGGAYSDADISQVKDFLSLSTRCLGIYPAGLDFTKEEKITALQKLNLKQSYIPKKIQDRLIPKKHKTNEIKLTHRQEQILNMIVSRGASNKIIARSLGISESTVKLHVAKLLQKYCVKNRTQLALSGSK